MAKKIGLESLEALRSEIEKQIREYKERLAREAAQHKAIDLLLKKNKFDVPEARIRYFVTQELKKEEVTDEEVAAGRERAVLEIRRYRILDWIANQEKIKPTQEEVDAHVELMAHSYGVPADVMKSHLRSSGRMAEVREDLRIDKTLNWLIGNRTEEEPKT
jgi:trigger factor